MFAVKQPDRLREVAKGHPLLGIPFDLTQRDREMMLAHLQDLRRPNRNLLGLPYHLLSITQIFPEYRADETADTTPMPPLKRFGR